MLATKRRYCLLDLMVLMVKVIVRFTYIHLFLSQH